MQAIKLSTSPWCFLNRSGNPQSLACTYAAGKIRERSCLMRMKYLSVHSGTSNVILYIQPRTPQTKQNKTKQTDSSYSPDTWVQDSIQFCRFGTGADWILSGELQFSWQLKQTSLGNKLQYHSDLSNFINLVNLSLISLRWISILRKTQWVFYSVFSYNLVFNSFLVPSVFLAVLAKRIIFPSWYFTGQPTRG